MPTLSMPTGAITDIQGKIELTINGTTYTAEIVEAWAAQDPRTDSWAAAAKFEQGSTWALQGQGPADAVARCMATAVSGHELGE